MYGRETDDPVVKYYDQVFTVRHRTTSPGLSIMRGRVMVAFSISHVALAASL
jgi:hypothetical protein